MRLRYIETATFAKSEATHYAEHRWRLGVGDVACLVSKTGKQMLFIYAKREVNHGSEATVLRSVRLRLLTGQTWHPTMLSHYAKEAGIQIEGIKRFEHYYRSIQS